MRIVGGTWRGRSLQSPRGEVTRPTADRVRQALFDIVMHAPWGGRDAVVGVRVLDAFAGTGALGLEALSRGAAFATFFEREAAALRALRANIAICRAEPGSEVRAADVLTASAAAPCGLVFLDPPYGQGLVPRALRHLRQTGWLAPSALIVVETGRDEAPPEEGEFLAERTHGKARLTFLRHPGTG